MIIYIGWIPVGVTHVEYGEDDIGHRFDQKIKPDGAHKQRDFEYCKIEIVDVPEPNTLKVKLLFRHKRQARG